MFTQSIQFIESAYASILANETSAHLYEGLSLYGEIDLYSFADLIHSIPLSAQDVFADLGSGPGKPTLYTFLATPVQKALGFEWDAARCAFAEQLKNRTVGTLDISSQRQCLFYPENILTANLNEVTCVYFDATAFPIPGIMRMSQILDALPNLKTILSLRPMIHLKHFSLLRRQRVFCSWDCQMAYLYTLR